MIRPGLEPRTACVLDRSDNQLHHRTDESGCADAATMEVEAQTYGGSNELSSLMTYSGTYAVPR